MTCPSRRFRVLILLAALLCLAAGCGKSAAPTVEGQTASLTASLHHATMGGPSVTWTFRFEQDADGTWKAVSHK